MENKFIDKAMQDAKETATEKKGKPKKASKKTAAKKKSKGPSTFVQILNGDFLTKEFMLKNLNFLFFIMLLLLLIVGKGYYGKKLSADVLNTQKKLDEATSDYFEAKAELEEKTRRTELVTKLKSTGLKETVIPTKVIRMKKNEIKD